MLTWQRYGTAIDIWSVGCILGEMLQGSPMFPGKDRILNLFRCRTIFNVFNTLGKSTGSSGGSH